MTTQIAGPMARIRLTDRYTGNVRAYHDSGLREFSVDTAKWLASQLRKGKVGRQYIVNVIRIEDEA